MCRTQLEIFFFLAARIPGGMCFIRAISRVNLPKLVESFHSTASGCGREMSKRSRYMVELAKQTHLNKSNDSERSVSSEDDNTRFEKTFERRVGGGYNIEVQRNESEIHKEQMDDEGSEVGSAGDENNVEDDRNKGDLDTGEDGGRSSDGSFEDPFSSDDSLRDKDYFPDSSASTDANSDSENYLESVSPGIYVESVNSQEGESTPSSEEQATETNDNELWYDIEDNDDEEVTQFIAQKSSLHDNYTSQLKKPIDFFNCFITDEILDIIVVETNNYACQQLDNRHSRKSRLNLWTPTNRNEMRSFLGITIAMGLTQVPHINLYWSKDNIYFNKFIASNLSRDRYLLLLKLLHFQNNEGSDTSNRLYKIDNIVKKLLQNFQNMLRIGNILVIDESMVPFRGRLLFRQYIPNKSHKYGIKLYKLCSPEGYTFNISIYTGKGDTQPDLGHSQSIVMKLLECVETKVGKMLFADNFYSSVPLVTKLLEEKMMYCGTLRSNRKGVPISLNVKKKMKRGEISGKKRKGVRIIKWMDKRLVLMITSVPSNTNLVATGKKNRNGQDILKPKCVIDYNNAKKGVDYSDQMSSYHTVLRRSMKWYRKVMFELILGTSVVNALIIYNMCSTTKLSITEFRRQLAYSLVQPPEKPVLPKKRIHTFSKPEGPGRKRRKPCKGCRQILKMSGLKSREIDKKVRRVTSFCESCPGQPGYCLNCFNAAHN